MTESELYGIRLFIDEEHTITAKHEAIMSANGVHQCLVCGHWTKGLVWLLDAVNCGDNELSIEELEAPPL